MGNIADDMKTLCEGIRLSYEDRRQAISDLRKETENIRGDARRFVKGIRSDLKEAHKAWMTMADILYSKRANNR